MAVDKMVDSGVLNGALEEIADAIRAKAGISGTLTFPDPNDFADAIDEYLIRPTGTKSITENGTNIDVANYAKVDVNVSGGGGIPLPTGFTQLEYADTTGSTAVDLNTYFTYPSTGYTFFLLFDVLNSSKTQIVFTSSTTVQNRTDQLVLLNNGRIRMDKTNNSTQRFPISVNDKIEYRSSYSNITNGSGYEYAYNNGNNCSYAESANAGMRDLTPAQTMKLFAEYKSNKYQTFATVRFRELMYKEGSTEIMHLYPVKDNNGTVCLYDTVGQTAIYPATGQFAQNAQALMSIGRTLVGE